MEPNTDFLEQKANDIRKSIVNALLTAGTGHSAGPLGMADVFTALYFYVMKHDPKNPKMEERDRFVLSAGHICPVHYATLAHAGYFPVGEFEATLRKLGTRFQGHPHNLTTPGVENSAGPLGQGTSVAAGIALAGLMDSKRWRVYCVTGDGELEEGQCWEAIWFAGKYKLHNLTFLVDRNNIQIDGFTEDIMPLEPLADKFAAFGWHVLEVDGHNFRQIIDACSEAKSIFEKPTVIICHTIPGKGVDFMEWKFEWHGKPPNKAEAELAIKELNDIRSLGGRIRGEHQ
ncbi:MAG: transketolase [Nanoarchaeota archaeon]|nr:MAG: transketolase [Nanoarchaeota archaeon]